MAPSPCDNKEMRPRDISLGCLTEGCGQDERHCSAALKRRDSFFDLSFIQEEQVDLSYMGGQGTVDVRILKGNFNELPLKAQQFIAENVALCHPRGVYICDGSDEEKEELCQKMEARGLLKKLDKMDNCYLARTDPADVARVEGKTFISTPEKYESVPHVKEGVEGKIGRWMSPEQADKEADERFPGCMAGRVMYVIPYSMGPVGSPLSKVGVELTDANYVVLSMHVMTRVTSRVWDIIEQDGGNFVRCLHSLGAPRPVVAPIISHWPCNPERTLILHKPAERYIKSYGSGYGGNSLLGKKCFALRIASCIARDEGWMAEHMLVMGVTNPAGVEKFIAAAFPSACGKTNMAMMMPSLPGWKVRCVGDDIAWMRFDKNGQLRAINPENGFFGVAPGTNKKTNPIAMDTVCKNTIFTNVAETLDGEVYWEGLEKEIDQTIPITTWKGESFKIGDAGKAAHPNSRFCSPASQCPIIHDKWEDPEGVPIDAIVFGGRRPEGVPLIYECFDWQHGVMTGAALKSETTAAAEFKGKNIMHDPMAMRPFFGYNCGDYFKHWLSLEKEGNTMPKVFHVNWFRLNEQGKFVWPGFGENIRVIDWMFKRIDGEDVAEKSPIGLLPKKGSLDVSGLTVDWDEAFSLPADYLAEDINETISYLDDQVGSDLPEAVRKQLHAQKQRIDSMKS